MRWLEHQWQTITPIGILLLPVSAAFFVCMLLRRLLYVTGLRRSVRLAVPVIVVGNVTVGGTGKTPLVIALVEALRERGCRPGVVSRGYGGSSARIERVDAMSDPTRCGDEPVLLARRTGVPVWIGRDRAAAGERLLSAHQMVNVIVSDDGLQHYRLARDIEIAVIDGAKGLGNRLLLPAGPLREPASRLGQVDAVVINGAAAPGTALPTGALVMHLEGATFHNLLNPAHQQDAARLREQRVHALAGIGNPQRFFAHLQRLGLEFVAHPYPDHYAFSAADLAIPDADAIVMTEKDAVKCAPYATEKCWALRVDAELPPGAADTLLRKLDKQAS